jgi:hypothetical protein
VTLVLIGLLSRYPPDPEAALALTVAIAAFAAGLFIPLLIWRRQGHRLQREREIAVDGSGPADATPAAVAEDRNGDYTE